MGIRARLFSLASQTLSDPTITGTSGRGYPIIVASSGVAVASPLDTNENTLATITIPANAMTANGRLRIRAMFTTDGSAGNKTYRVRFGGTQFFSSVRTTQTTNDISGEIMNLNATNAQRSSSWIEVTSAALTFGVSATGAVDTTVARDVTITMQKATGTDVVTLVWHYVELIKA